MSGVLNLPLIRDTLAIRLVGYNYDYSGYVDNVGASDPEVAALADFYGATVVDKLGVGGAEYAGARASILWKPTDDLSFTLMYARQDLDQDGETEVNLSKGGYTNIPMQIGNINGGDEQKTSDLDLLNLVRKLKGTTDQADMAIRIALSIANADGEYEEAEKKVVKELCGVLGISPAEFV